MVREQELKVMVMETLQYKEEQEPLTKETTVELDQAEELIEQAVAVEELLTLDKLELYKDQLELVETV